MPDATSGTSQTNLGALQKLTQGQAAPAKKGSQLGKEEFLQLLVTQLKNQDPLDPMKNEEFAVNLAQFSQLEQLISINQKVGTPAAGDLSSMASYLGRQVTLNSKKINVSEGQGDSIKINLDRDVQGLRVELLDGDGKAVASKEFGAVSKGNHDVVMNGVSLPNGEYGFRVVATGLNGGTFSPIGKVAGIVSGFRPGPTPTLLIGSREISPGDISEVTIPN